MKKIYVILFTLFLSIACFAQSGNYLYSDSSNILLSTFKLLPLNPTINNTLYTPAIDMRAIEFKNKKRFTIYQSYLNNQYLIYDSYRQEYKPIQPYGNFCSALIGGTINSIIMLFEGTK